MCNNQKFYKYVSFESKHWEDIFVNNRLYASTFENFNDMFEGLYEFCIEKNNMKKLLDIIKQKQQFKICCFSETLQNANEEILMWAHYANSHNGFRIEFELKEDKPIKVSYSDKTEYIENPNKIDIQKIKKLLTTKKEIWKYEKEYRVLTTENYVNINISNVTLGKKLLDVAYRYENSKDIPKNILCYAKKIRCLNENNELKIECFKNRFENKKIEIRDKL